MRFVVITGTSGAGKTVALHSFEDAAYYSVDNLPPRLLPSLAAFCQDEGHMRSAVCVDARSGASFAELPVIIQEMRNSGLVVEILFLDASDSALVQRFKETRRPHALLRKPSDSAATGGILEAIQAERAVLNSARALADKILDTSTLTPGQLREIIHSDYAGAARPGLLVTITSFGFKYGLPVDADLVFDVRFLVNPHYVPALQPLDGRDRRVADYVRADPHTAELQERMYSLVEFSLPQYQREGKAYLNIAIGCTGGKHRSVVLAEELERRLRSTNYQVVVRHRDLGGTRPESTTLSTETSLSALDAGRQDSEGADHA
jgi:UPF0042 nucleotide-binding protein